MIEPNNDPSVEKLSGGLAAYAELHHSGWRGYFAPRPGGWGVRLQRGSQNVKATSPAFVDALIEATQAAREWDALREQGRTA